MPKKSKPITDDERGERFEKVALPYLRRLGISQSYNITIAWASDEEMTPEPAEEDQSFHSTPHWPECSVIPTASVDSTYPYRDIGITFRRSIYDKLSDKELTRLVLHETMHRALMGPLSWRISALSMPPGVEDECARMEEDIIDKVVEWCLSMEATAPCCHTHKTKPRSTR